MVSDVSVAPARPRGTVLGLGGGGFSTGESTLLDDLLLDLARPHAAEHGRADRPRVCFVPTASGDAAGYGDAFRKCFDDKAEASVLSLFWRDGSDMHEHLLSQDAIFVGGGSTLNLLALWRLHGIDTTLTAALRSGVVLSGVSAGMNCWFDDSVTDSHGPLQALGDGLGFVPGSACPHYDGEIDRRPTYLDLVATGGIPAGYAVEDGCALLFRDGELVQGYSERLGARAFRVHRADGATERPIEVTYLG